MDELTDKKKKIISYLLEIASDIFGNHGCNDLPEDLFSDWSEQEINKLAIEIAGKEIESEDNYVYLRDDLLMSHFSKKIIEGIK